VYTNFTHSQKCWPHLLRKAIKLTLMDPSNQAYRDFTDKLLEIYRQACRVQRDRRLSDEGRQRKVSELSDEILDLSGGIWAAELPKLEGPADDFRRLCNELMRLLLANELFTFVTASDVTAPNGEKIPVAGTNNEAERELRGPAMARDTGRTSKSVPGARRCTVITSVLQSLRRYLPEFNLSAILRETANWKSLGQSCFAKQLARIKRRSKRQADVNTGRRSVLDILLPLPAD
jgi:transposase